MLAATMAGALIVVRPGADGGPVAATPINLGLDALVDRTIRWIGPRKGTVDATRGVLWLPIQQLRAPGVCTGDPCSLDQWLMRIDLEQLLGLAHLTTPADDTARHEELTAAPMAPTPPTCAPYVPVPSSPAGDSAPRRRPSGALPPRRTTSAHRSTRRSRRARRCQVRLRRRTTQFHVKSSRRTGTCTIKRKRGQ